MEYRQRPQSFRSSSGNRKRSSRYSEANPNEATMNSSMGSSHSGSRMNANSNHNGRETTESIIKDLRHASRDTLLQTAANVVAEKTEHVRVLDLAAEERVPKFDSTDLKIGKVIGRGGFCVVHEVKVTDDSLMNRNNHGDLDSTDKSGGGFVSKFAMKRRRKRSSVPGKGDELSHSNHNPYSSNKYNSRTSSEPSLLGGAGTASDWASNSDCERRGTFRYQGGTTKLKYVLKRISQEHTSKIQYLKGVVDIAMETKYLASLDHPNIIGLYGVSSDGPFVQDYFIILEKMKDTLTKRIKKWMDLDRQCKGITGVFTGSKKKIKQLQCNRIVAAIDIARGGDYLHKQRIVFRDLKPDNIGFNNADMLKIFDFGLAKELKDEDRVGNNLYKMTGLTGALRYMAPEVGLSQPYNQSADVYSWAMIFWYSLALEPPFVLYSPKMIEDRVFNRDYRPKIFTVWSDRVVNVMTKAWSKNMHQRPTFSQVIKELKEELAVINPTHPYLRRSEDIMEIQE